MSCPGPVQSLSTYTISKNLLSAIQTFFKDEQIRLLKLTLDDEKDRVYYLQPEYMPEVVAIDYLQSCASGSYDVSEFVL